MDKDTDTDNQQRKKKDNLCKLHGGRAEGENESQKELKRI